MGGDAVSTDSQPDAPRGLRERGAVLIEAALILPIIFMLVFGIIDFGTAYNQSHELRATAREGARIAAVDNGCFPGSPDASTARCTASSSTQLAALKTDTRARAAGLADPNTITVTVCYPSPVVVGSSNVTITVTYPLKSVTGFFGALLNNRVLTGKSVMRLEQMPTYGPADSNAC
jgi:Flp pilus assembly protein TadG